MNECIICRKQKNKGDFSDEHVIPESLGGYYHIYSVCRDCNSKLGERVDCTITNHKLAKFHRYIYNIKGKSGKIPNPLDSKKATLYDNPKQKVRICMNKEGKIDAHILPNIPTLEEIQKEILATGKVSLTIDKRYEKQIDKILGGVYKKIGKIGMSLEEFKSGIVTSTHKSFLHIQDTMDIDIRKYKMGLLKIAYEFAVDNIPEYYNDDWAILISQILDQANFEAIDKCSFFRDSGFNWNLCQALFFINTTSQNYSLTLVGHESYGTFCFICLAKLFNAVIILSDKNYLKSNFILGINDFQQRKFIKYQRSEIVKKISLSGKYRFCYWFSSHQDMIKFSQLEMLINFDFYQINGSIPLFNENGKITYKNIESKLTNIPKNFKKIKINKTTFSEIFELNESLYIRLLPTNKFYRITAVEIIYHKI
ncbi:hypothetical protein PN36_13780 [Candidatus Thiomargarita nelsonii]|uniref:HNH endonuclease 5 domain-containing protein n=1 Tax=Candidatus Thiomargarita nelsonii TaxID=1003181 RepID=A0A4E0QVK7_9GAMM|nr:hypothetical protein PN36_13780 [Candidatus Thiomargarita nelsonii]